VPKECVIMLTNTVFFSQNDLLTKSSITESPSRLLTGHYMKQKTGDDTIAKQTI
jgi:hypothetical protein